MDEKLRFLARLLEVEKMAPLCRKYGISRETAYKIYNVEDDGAGSATFVTRLPGGEEFNFDFDSVIAEARRGRGGKAMLANSPAYDSARDRHGRGPCGILTAATAYPGHCQMRSPDTYAAIAYRRFLPNITGNMSAS